MASAPAEDRPTGAQGDGSRERRDIGDEATCVPHPSLIPGFAMKVQNTHKSVLCSRGRKHTCRCFYKPQSSRGLMKYEYLQWNAAGRTGSFHMKYFTSISSRGRPALTG